MGRQSAFAAPLPLPNFNVEPDSEEKFKFSIVSKESEKGLSDEVIAAFHKWLENATDRQLEDYVKDNPEIFSEHDDPD